MRTQAEFIGEVSAYLAERLSSASAEIGVLPFEDAPWSETVPVPEVHRVRAGGRILIGSVLVPSASTPPSAQVVLAGELCPDAATRAGDLRLWSGFTVPSYVRTAPPLGRTARGRTA